MDGRLLNIYLVLGGLVVAYAVVRAIDWLAVRSLSAPDSRAR